MFRRLRHRFDRFLCHLFGHRWQWQSYANWTILGDRRPRLWKQCGRCFVERWDDA